MFFFNSLISWKYQLTFYCAFCRFSKRRTATPRGLKFGQKCGKKQENEIFEIQSKRRHSAAEWVNRDQFRFTHSATEWHRFYRISKISFSCFFGHFWPNLGPLGVAVRRFALHGLSLEAPSPSKVVPLSVLEPSLDPIVFVKLNMTPMCSDCLNKLYATCLVWEPPSSRPKNGIKEKAPR